MVRAPSGRGARRGLAVALGFVVSVSLAAVVSTTHSATRFVAPLAHLIDLALGWTVGLGAALLVAVAHAALDRLQPSTAARRWIERAGLAALHVALSAIALRAVCERAAHAIASYPLATPLVVLLVVALGLLPVLVVAVARALVRPRASSIVARRRGLARVTRFGVWLCALLAMAAATANGRLFPRAAPELHCAVVWLVALWIAEIASARIDRARPLRARGRIALALLAVGAVAVSLVPPSNHARLLLFRSPTSLGARVFAAIAWRMPELPPGLVDDRAPRSREHPPPTRVPGLDSPIVVLVTIDSLRADVLFGDEGSFRLPNLSALARQGVAFTNARAAANDSVLSLASLFASRPRSALVWSRAGEGASYRDYPLEDPSPRLAQVLDAAGVATTSVVSASFLSARFGVARGFGEERVLARGGGRALAPAVGHALDDALADATSAPRFLFAHYTDAHYPYRAPEPRGGTTSERYLRSLAAVDEQIGALIEAVDLPGIRDRVVLVVAGDHGESFGEHGPPGRSRRLHEETIRVPLVVRSSRLRAHVVGEPVSLLDVAPTIAELFALAPPPSFLGASLVPLLVGQRVELDRPIVAESETQRARYGPTLKAIFDEERKTVEVFDLVRDSGERANLFPAVARVR